MSANSKPTRNRLLLELAYPFAGDGIDGIGSHTIALASALSDFAHVSVLMRRSAVAPAEGAFEVRPALSGPPARPTQGMLEAVLLRPPDWLLVQYNPFSWGKRGWAPELPVVVRRLRRSIPTLGIGLIVHETFMPLRPIKPALMSVYQRAQLWALGREAHAIYCSITAWTHLLRKWFPGKVVEHLPVGSNIASAGVARAATRQELHVDDSTVLLGVFGTAHPSRLPGHVAEAYARLARGGCDTRLIYVGPAGSELRVALGTLPFRDLGPLPERDVSRVFCAMDIHLVPYSDGVSSRRSAFMTGLSHNVASLTTLGRLTDPLLADAVDKAFLATPAGDVQGFAEAAAQLTRDKDLRTRLGPQGRALYDREFSWPVVGKRLIQSLTEVERPR